MPRLADRKRPSTVRSNNDTDSTSEVEEYVNHDVFERVVIAEQRTVDYNTMTYKTEFAYNQAGDVLGSGSV